VNSTVIGSVFVAILERFSLFCKSIAKDFEDVFDGSKMMYTSRARLCNLQFSLWP
jgi:hypothetical protein